MERGSRPQVRSSRLSGTKVIAGRKRRGTSSRTRIRLWVRMGVGVGVGVWVGVRVRVMSIMVSVMVSVMVSMITVMISSTSMVWWVPFIDLDGATHDQGHQSGIEGWLDMLR